MSKTPLWFRRLLVGGVSTLTAGGMGLAGLLSTAGAAGATSNFTVTSLAGANRFATAVAVAKAAFPSGLGSTSTVIIASGLGTNLPDSLAASYLAGVLDAPILLTEATGVPPETTAELAALAPKNVVIVGGTGAVSAAESTTFSNNGAVNVVREAGANRFLTADAIDGASTKVGANKTAIVADGVDQNLVDALGASPLADAGPYPLFLINGAAGTLSSMDLAIMHTDGITNVVIVGGSAAVGPQVATQLAGAGITAANVHQVAGPDRSATSEALANYEIANDGFTKTSFNIASGDQGHLVDALSGGPLGGAEKAPTLITNGITDAGSVPPFAMANSATEASANLFGGSAAVSSSVLSAIEVAAKSAPAVPTSLPTLVSASITGTALVGNNTGATPGTTVQYVFSKSVTGATINSGGFHVYAADAAVTEYSDGTAKADTTNADAVDVLYTDAALQTTAGAATLTLATVSGAGSTAGPAVVSSASGSNPAGSEPIGTSATTGLTSGVTLAPDLVSAAANGAANTTGMTAVNVTFNKAAYTAAGAGTGHFGLVLTDGFGSTCSAPTSPVSGGGTASGGTVVGGDGTTTFTLVCADDTATPTTAITTAQIARAIDLVSTVTDAAGANPNPAEATSSPNTTVNANTQPDVSAVALNLKVGSGANKDSITYTFNGPVSVAIPTGFLGIKSDGTTVALTEDATLSTSTTLVFEDTDPNFNQIVGASVAQGAVKSTNNSALNAFNELGVTNSTSSSTTSGVVAGPQLKAAALAPYTHGAGTSLKEGLYTFSEPVSLTAATGLDLYDNKYGTQLTCKAGSATVVSGTPTEVACTDYTTSAGAATQDQIAHATLGTADQGAVKGTGTPDTTSNPEGAAS